MTSQNVTFFKKNSFHQGSFKSKKTLKKGVYSGRLIEVKAGQGKAYHGEETRDTLSFFFELDGGEVVTRTVGASNHQQSKCMELVNSMSVMSPPSLEVIKSTEKLQEHILSLIGKSYRLEIEPSQCGRYSNIEKIIPELRLGA